MHFILDLLQGAGLAAAIGIRPFVPVLLAGALAAANLGLDFDGTDFSFLESWPFLLGVLLLVAGLYVVAGIALLLGALVAAGSIADRSDAWWVGVLAGLLCAALGFQAARSLFARIRRRLDEQTARVLPVYAE